MLRISSLMITEQLNYHENLRLAAEYEDLDDEVMPLLETEPESGNDEEDPQQIQRTTSAENPVT